MSLKKIGVLVALFGTLLIPSFVLASGSNSHNDRYDRNDRDRYSYSYNNNYSNSFCDNYTYHYNCSYSMGYSYPSYNNYSYSYPQYYQAPQYYEKSPNASLTVLSLPNTGFEPKTAASLAFALLVLLSVGFVLYPYVRKAFTVVLR